MVASHDVCLGIFGDTDKALSVVPTKVYQGAAAGCAVVTSDTAPHRMPGWSRLCWSPRPRRRRSPALEGSRQTRGKSFGCGPRRRERARAFDPWHAVGPLVAGLGSVEAEPASSVAPVARGGLLETRPGFRAEHPGRLRFDVVSRVVDDLAPRTVLEVGCGQGAVGARLATRATYVGVEPDAQVVS